MLALRSTGALGAAYLPGGVPEADPPTGTVDRAGSAPAPPAGNGIQWALAPPRYEGTASINARWFGYSEGGSSTLEVVAAQVNFATYVWQPWFIQLRGGVGALVSHDTNGAASNSGNAGGSTNGVGLTGNLGVAVFPMSRFPFEARAEVSDSRTNTDTIGTDYRSQRLTLNQAYSPPVGNSNYYANLEYSRLAFNDGTQDTVTNLNANATQRVASHGFDLTGQWIVNERSDVQSRSEISLLDARYTYQPDGSFNVDTLASWNETKQVGGILGNRFDFASDVRQISSFATWRPREGQWLYSPDAPMYVTGSARVIDAGVDSGLQQRVRGMNASLGFNQEYGRNWRLAGSVSGTQAQTPGGGTVGTATAAAALNFSPEAIPWGAWLYTPTVGTSLGAFRTSAESDIRLLGGAQITNSLSRNFGLGGSGNVSLNLSQSLGAVYDSQEQVWARAMANSAGLSWVGTDSALGQSYAALTLSDSRVQARESGSFQLVNLQLNQRVTVTRNESWSGNLTAQATRSDSTVFDAFTGQRIRAAQGWQNFYSGSLTYDNQRLFGVPRLRMNALLSVNSVQLVSRAAGDVEAPPDAISESLEGRIDYMIGRLDARLGARFARIDGRGVAQIYARVQRTF